MNGRPILLVEDDPDDIEFLEMHLRSHCVTDALKVCRDGREALAFLEEQLRIDPAGLPSLVIADVKMPRMTGLELIRRLRLAPGLRDIPVVFLTSSDDQSDRKEAREAGARLYLRKPLQYRQFGEVVEKIKGVLHQGSRR